jgi:Uma2 family endonuclease
MSAPTLRRQFTVRDYSRMRETGILTEDDRVELLDGEIYQMSPLGSLHIAIVNRLNKLLMRQVGDDAILSIQNSVQLNDYSESQPDVALLSSRDDYYEQALARPDDILLLIEVSDISLDYDRDQKLPRYAASNIAEVWIVDVDQQVVEQYLQPMQGPVHSDPQSAVWEFYSIKDHAADRVYDRSALSVRYSSCPITLPTVSPDSAPRSSPR